MQTDTLSRRDFLQISGALSAAAFVPQTGYFFKLNNRLTDQLGLQLYTVRDVLTEKPQETLEAIRSAGYRQVELFDSQLLPQLQPVLKGLGISVNSTHFSSPLLTGNWEPLKASGVQPPPADYTIQKAIDQAAQYEVQYFVFPYLFPQDRGGLDTYKALAEKLNQTGELCRKAGMYLGYHNHSFEFQPMENTSPMEILLSETDPEHVCFELDVFWVSVAGINPAEYLKEHAERIRLLHLKDKQAGVPTTFKAVTMPPESFQPIGKGVIDFSAILVVADASPVQYVFVEQDHSPDPLADIRTSSEYLRQL